MKGSLMFYVYHITKNESHIGYVGVSNNPRTRWKYHRNNDYPVGRAIRKHNLIFENDCRILFKGSEEDCYRVEAALRPHKNMGYNVAVGGYGACGKDNIVHARTPEALAKAVASMRDGRRKGENNTRAKKWILTSPTGMEYISIGNIQKLCDGLNLTRATLIKHLGNQVPDTTRNGSGGYRKISEELHTKRINTIGWKLIEGTRQ